MNQFTKRNFVHYVIASTLLFKIRTFLSIVVTTITRNSAMSYNRCIYRRFSLNDYMIIQFSMRTTSKSIDHNFWNYKFKLNVYTKKQSEKNNVILVITIKFVHDISLNVQITIQPFIYTYSLL